MANTNVGLRDIPLEKLEDESLGISDYVHALSDFILTCETPMTVALQGDWGSGKTSFMNLIRKKIEQENKMVQTIWFNSWQYSQFGMQNDIALALLYNFVSELSKNDEGTIRKVFGDMAGKFLKGAVIAVTSAAGAGDVGKAIVESQKPGDVSETMQLLNMRSKLDALVKNKFEKEQKDRIIVFIDDLDRLLPEKAVDLLEVFKLFLEIPGCVYVLACDYHVIEKGLKQKFNLSPEELKGKSFFDKIIQLPFSMPIAQYDVTKYMKNLLNKINLSPTDDDIEIYKNIAKFSIGFNPRSLKRVFNSLQLLNLVADRKNMYSDQASKAEKREKQRIMFATLCLQMIYEPVYRYLVQNSGNLRELFDTFRDVDKLKNITELSSVIEELSVGSKDETFNKLSAFMDIFYNCIQLSSDNDDKSLSDIEIKTVSDILTFSSLTSTDSGLTSSDGNKERYGYRDKAKKLIDELNVKYAPHMSKLKPFRIYQSNPSSKVTETSVYIPLSIEGGSLEIGFAIRKKQDYIGVFFIWASKKEILNNIILPWIKKTLPEDYTTAQTWEGLPNRYHFWEVQLPKGGSPEVEMIEFRNKIIWTCDYIMPKLEEFFGCNDV